MSVLNFIQTVWSKSIQDKLELKTVLVDNCHREYEGDVDHAKTVKILAVGEPTIADYDKDNGIEPEAMSDEGQDLVIDQAKAFAFLVEDVDKAQSVPGLMEEYQRKSVHGLAVARDTYVATLIKGGANVTTATGKTEAAIKQALDLAIVALRERNFDEEGVIELTPAVYNAFKNQLITTSTNNPELIAKGVVGKYDSFDVIMSNNLVKDEGHAYCCVRGKKAIAFAGQINKVEALRHPKKFADIVRGLDTFGAKVIDEGRIQVVKVPV
jgi:hypothetical protein